MKTILQKLYNQQPLSYQEAFNAIELIIGNHINEAQVAAFISVFNCRFITLPEITAFRDALLSHCTPLDLNEFNCIDLCGTGGDGKDTFNISTLASFVVAGAGEKVAKHGNYSLSSISGSSNMLEYIGYKMSNQQDKLKKELDKTNICFIHAPLFHQGLKNVATVRKSLGVKTFFNSLGPLLNPSQPNNQITGVFSLELARIYYYLYQSTTKNFTILHNLDGYDEIALTDAVKTYSNKGESLYKPTDLGFNTLQPSQIKGQDSIEENGKLFLKILDGKGTEAQNNVVIANAAMALQTIRQNDFATCVADARASLESKKAKQVLTQLINLQ